MRSNMKIIVSFKFIFNGKNKTLTYHRFGGTECRVISFRYHCIVVLTMITTLIHIHNTHTHNTQPTHTPHTQYTHAHNTHIASQSKQASKQANTQASKQANTQASKQANTQASKQANTQASKQASAYKYTDI